MTTASATQNRTSDPTSRSETGDARAPFFAEPSPPSPPRGTAPPDRQRNVDRILEAYRRTPGTLGQIRPADRRLAQTLVQRGIPPALVEAALLLTAARRTVPPLDGNHRPPIRSLHYFLPVIEELLDQPPDPSYLRYLTDKLQRERHPTATTSPDDRPPTAETTPSDD